MQYKKTVAFVAFGEINTPIEKLNEKHDAALEALQPFGWELVDGGLVIDDARYETADAAITKLKKSDFAAVILCVCGWIPTHALIRVTDEFRHLPMLLWGQCGWREGGKIITTAEQAGTSAIRPTLEELGYRFAYVYNVIGQPLPLGEIEDYITAALAAKQLRHMRVGTMGYRDMLLYGTQYEGFSMRRELGLEVESFEMLEMVQNLEKLDEKEVDEEIAYIRKNWIMEKPCDEAILQIGVRYALAVEKKIRERGYDAVSLLDVDGMKKLLGFPPAMVFMILARRCGVPTTPENDIMGNATQLIAQQLTGQNPHYMEYYEFFEKSVLIGVPDYVPETSIDGETRMLPSAFGLLSASLLNVSKVKTGRVTCVRLIYRGGKYALHIYTGTAQTPAPWEEYGWEPPAPQLPSLEIALDMRVADFAQKVASQHVIVVYGDQRKRFEAFAKITGMDII